MTRALNISDLRRGLWTMTNLTEEHLAAPANSDCQDLGQSSVDFLPNLGRSLGDRAELRTETWVFILNGLARVVLAVRRVAWLSSASRLSERVLCAECGTS